jgi:uncharacterized protein (DUF697 family)
MSAQSEIANNIVKSHVLWSMGAGLIPLPIIDMVAVTAVQLDMLKQLSAVYGHDFSETSGKSWISALTGTYLARLGAQAVKAIPGVGALIGGVSMAALSGASTYAIGQVFIQHFESGGDLFNFDSERFKQFYKEQFEKGKEYAQKWKKEKESEETGKGNSGQGKSNSSSSDLIDKLRELSELRDKGIISDDDFEKMKRKIMSEL